MTRRGEPARDRSSAAASAVDVPLGAHDHPAEVRTPVPVAGLVGRPPPLRQDDGDQLGGSEVPASSRAILTRRRRGGAALPAGVARRMEEGFGVPLDGVRIHSDGESHDLTRQLQATAFTHGSDLYFSRGSYSPETGPGRRLLAHELAHVAQQRAGGLGGGTGTLTIGHAADPAEAQADAMADRVLQSRPVPRGPELRRGNLREWADR